MIWLISAVWLSITFAVALRALVILDDYLPPTE